MSEKSKSEVFDCEVIMSGGKATHTVCVKGITDQELKVLSYIHGDKSVFNVSPVGVKEIDLTDDAFECALKYHTNQYMGVHLVERVLGKSFGGVEGFDQWMKKRDASNVEANKRRRDFEERWEMRGVLAAAERGLANASSHPWSRLHGSSQQLERR